MSMNERPTAAEATSPPERLYPASIAYLIEERPLLWYEDPKQYDDLLLQQLTEMSPKGAMNCIFVKNLVDHIWELRRMKKMKHVAINFVMPHAAVPLLAPTEGLCGNPDREKVLWQAADVTCGIASEVEEGEMDFSERMASMSVEFIGGTGDGPGVRLWRK